jgi:hypothetical protein
LFCFFYRCAKPQIHYIRIMKAIIFFLLCFCPCLLLSGGEKQVAFTQKQLGNPRLHHEEIINRFRYTETGTFILPADSLHIVLFNSYARARISNPESLIVDHDQYRVKKIQVVFTKYPFDKNKWLTNYYDLLGWRLTELFQLDGHLNDHDIDFEMVLQTDCTTASLARGFFHGIVVELEPVAVVSENPPTEHPVRVNQPPIENGGSLIPDRIPDYFRSPYQFEPEPGRPLRRQMDPKKLKCPSWR